VARGAGGERAPQQTAPPQRILVALSNPETAEELTDLALLIHDPDSTVPIYPMTVVRDGPDSDTRVAAAEAMLGRAVLHAAAADVEMKPLTRLDHNPAAGIVRATREERISTVLIGWNGESTARAFVFGSVLDQLLAETREMLWVCRLRQPLSTLKRVLVLVPPYLSRETGFDTALRAVKTMARQAGAELVFVAAERSADELETSARSIKPNLPLKLHRIEAWAAVVRGVDALYRPGDLIVLLTAREGSLAWRPALNRLPRVLAHHFDDAGLLVVYPSDVPLRTLVGPPSGGGARALARAIAPDWIQTGLTDDLSEEAVLRRLLAPLAEVDGADTDALLDRLRAGGTDYAVELRPGVAFYHAHTSRVDRTRLLVGTSADGLHLPAASGGVHVVLVFLCPRTVDSGRYLSKLSAIAHLVQDDEQIEALSSVTSSEEAADLLHAALAEPD
jgi:mannitol/fructose-specific phosphotransferase system IIA component (Ntr-type)